MARLTSGPVLLAALLLSLELGVTPAPPAYAEAMKQARAAFIRADYAAAKKLAQGAVALAEEPEGGARSAQVRVLLGDIARREKRYLAANWAYREAGVLAGDDLGLRARTRALRRVVAREGKLLTLEKRLDNLAKQDRRVADARARPAAGKRAAVVRQGLAEAAQAYKSDKDPRRADEALALAALVAARSGEPEVGVSEAQAVLQHEGALRSTRLAALEALWRGHEAAGRLPESTAAALRLNATMAEKLPEERRRYHRMRFLAAICARFEETAGSGACARLERQATGHFTFDDFSRERVRRELSEDDLARAHRQFLPALEDCLREQAKQDRDRYEGADIRISWSIQPKGNAADLEIAPKRYLEDLGPCVQVRLSWFRYPRYSSPERKSITVPYRLD